MLIVRSIAALAVTLALAPAAQAQSSADYLVTIAARECADYDDIRANLARNNIQESLEDLGADSLYESGEPVDPITELAGQPACRPIVGWRFTWGSGIIERAVSGPWGSLSIVSNPDAAQPVTEESVPPRDFAGRIVDGPAIRGAVTVTLDGAQVGRAGSNSLWLQGGTPEDPMLYGVPQFTGRYGFGALRCAIDDLNGDNVETVAFPSGSRHVYCYAYYVTPPPSSGTIVIRKEIEGAESAVPFHFSGNLSYNEGGAFDVPVGGEETFIRAETREGDTPWSAVEQVPPGWTLTGIDCTSSQSTATTDVAAARVDIVLVAGDTVTCTYRNRLTPPAGALLIAKRTENGLGTFRFRVTGDDGDVVARPRATTRREGLPAPALPGPTVLDPGTYRVSERLPSSDLGVWRQSGVRCNGEETAEVDITAGQGALCVFDNRLVRPGRIAIRKVTLGGTGTAAFLVSPLGDPSVQRRQTATTRREDTAVRARGQSLRRLPYGRYVIQESAADPEERGRWTLVSVVCDGRTVPFAQGRAVVRITERDPAVDCRFVNQRRADPDPPDPPGPDPESGGDEPDLQVEKEVTDVQPGVAPVVTFRITITNEGPVSASDVVVSDQLRGMTLVSARPSQGTCTQAQLVTCSLGGLAAGDSATITVRVRLTSLDAPANVATAGSGSPDASAANNADRVRVRGATARGRVCAARAPVARAAC